MAGSTQLIAPFALLALVGLFAAWRADGWRPLNPAAIALPWLVVPPFVLIATSFVKPVYYVRYVEFCLPALAILAGAGLTGLIRLATVAPLGRFRLGRFRLAWLPAALVVAVLAVLLAGPQQAARQTAARPDNLRLASAIVAAHEQPGDVVFYIPATMHVLGTGYPAPFSRLRDIARSQSAIASGHPDRHRDHQSRRDQEPVHRRQAGVGGHRRQQLQVPHAVHPGGQGEDGAAGRDAHPEPLAGRRGHAHPVRVLSTRLPMITLLSVARPPMRGVLTLNQQSCDGSDAWRTHRRVPSRSRPGQAPDDSACGAPRPPAVSCSRIFLRPRCSRDITVPTGVPIISAISR